MNTVIFANQKGGTGKSTLAVLYAWWLADRGRARVCFIDLDSQGNSSKTLQREACGPCTSDLFEARATCWPTCPAGRIAVSAGDARLIDLERARPELAIPAFRRHVEALSPRFDACVIDTPPALGLRMSAALIAGDAVVCPVELEEYSIDGVREMLRTVFGVRERFNPGLRLAGIVANRLNSHSLRQRAALGALISSYGEFVVPGRISTRSAIPESLALGIPVWRLQKTAAREAAAETLTVFELLAARAAVASGRSL